MARAGNMLVDIEYSKFDKALDVMMDHVQRGTKKATTAACQEILAESLKQVPRETNTLADSAGYQVFGAYRNFTGLVGYGYNGNPINPKTGQRATEYMVAVHENLFANHPVGKAKFLEDPMKAYQRRILMTFAKNLKDETGM